MKASELRIGNLVYYRSENDNNEFENYLCKLDGYDLYKMQNDVQYSESHLPIPLTEKWFIKAGFKRVKPRRGVQKAYKLKSLRINMSNSGNFYRFSRPICYVHKLQNLYYELENQELTF